MNTRDYSNMHNTISFILITDVTQQEAAEKAQLAMSATHEMPAARLTNTTGLSTDSNFCLFAPSTTQS